MSAAERLLKLAQQDIERERAAFKAEMDLEREKLAERWREVDRLHKQLVPPKLESKQSEPSPVASAGSTPVAVPQGLVDITDGYSALVLAAIIEQHLKNR